MGLPSRTPPSLLIVYLLTAVLLRVAPAQQPTQAATVPLILPGGLAYDSSGNLYFAETANHLIRRLSPAGTLTIVAGTGTQGFSGDFGPATAALLDSPTAVALDPLGNLFLADSHNHRIRRIDAATGIITTIAGPSQLDLPTALALDSAQNLFVADARTHLILRIDHITAAITTVAGNGTQGFSGDNGPATHAAIDSPYGLALDPLDNLFLADTHNHRIRRIDSATGVITSIAGTSHPGFSGDGTSAASLNLPRGLALDALGNLFLVDARNHRIRRIDSSTGLISTIAGDGSQAYAGDNALATAASLNSPRALALSPGALLTIADSGNQRIRQVDSAAIIHTIAGLGDTSGITLSLTGPAVTLYGTGTLTASLLASPATGAILFFDNTVPLISTPLTTNTATLLLSALSAGPHRLTATYLGDTLHAAAQSPIFALTISPAPASATPKPIALVYGQPIPTLTGSLTGILPPDAAYTTLALASIAAPLSPPAAYLITASLTGPAAGNYILTTAPAFITTTRAPSAIAFANSLAVHVASTTAGTPSGTVTLLDAGTPSASATLSPTGDAQFSSATLTLGTHTLTAAYAGDPNFLAATSAPQIATIGPVASADFTLVATGQSAITVPAGTPAAFSFAVTPFNGALSSPIQLTASGLPPGASASFNPSYLPPSNNPSAFILTLQIPKTAALTNPNPLVYAILLPLLMVGRRRKALPVIALAVSLATTLGCGDRINTAAATAAIATYNITVTGTATTLSGITLQHFASVTLTVQH